MTRCSMWPLDLLKEYIFIIAIAIIIIIRPYIPSQSSYDQCSVQCVLQDFNYLNLQLSGNFYELSTVRQLSYYFREPLTFQRVER